MPVGSLYDVHIKRIHEYKRQYMNMISIIYRYKKIKVRTCGGPLPSRSCMTGTHVCSRHVSTLCRTLGLSHLVPEPLLVLRNAALFIGQRRNVGNTGDCVRQEATPEERKKIVPRVVMVGGKAASAYYMAKKIVKLVNAIGQKVCSFSALMPFGRGLAQSA